MTNNPLHSQEMEDDHKDTLAESMVDVVLSGLAN